MPDKSKNVTLRQLLAVLGFPGPGDPTAMRGTTVCVAPAGHPTEYAVTSAYVLYDAYKDAPVLKYIPKGRPGGVPEGDLFLLGMTPKIRKGYLENPDPIRYNAPSWRLGDTAWFVPCGTDVPVSGKITAAAGPVPGSPGVKFMIAAQSGNSAKTYPDVPEGTLFPTREAAARALLEV